MRRASGILLHPTCLPGGHGIGDLGPVALEFVDALVECRQSWWQILPLGPVGEGDSPYQSASSWGGEPLLISLDELVAEGWLDRADLDLAPAFPLGTVDYELARGFKLPLLRKAAENFERSGSPAARDALEGFCERERVWLDPLSEFLALRQAHDGLPWNRWTRDQADPSDVRTQQFIQFVFFRQWDRLKRYCRLRRVQLIGDVPIFVAHDSADVRSHPELFYLDPQGDPLAVAGVPPDYFSPTGQRWGNPLYRWDRLAEDGYRWWIERMAAAMRQVDLVRMDHFRGLEKYYEIPASEPTALHGRWVDGPGEKLLAALREGLGKLPFIAEDLGMITPEVGALRDLFDLPGMRVLQFAFSGDAQNPFLPHNYVRNCVAYTATHDNDTTVGWLQSDDGARHAVEYLNSSGREIHWDFIRAVLASVADLAIIPLQDILGLGCEARMNLPGSQTGNWRWRLLPGQWSPECQQRLANLTHIYGRD